MPYINQVARDILEPKIDALAQLLKSYSDDEIEGVMNYTITELINLSPKDLYGFETQEVDTSYEEFMKTDTQEQA